MIEEHDDEQIRCRRLGHPLTFKYCRVENDGEPCRLILDCWWERFDVQSFLEAHLPEEAYAKLERRDPPKPKMQSIVEMIEEAKQRIAKENEEK